MPYITLANAKKIIYRTDIKSLNISGEVYKIRIHFFSKYEHTALLAIQELLKDPEHFFNEIYVPYKPTDTYRYVYEGFAPAYHLTTDCPRLNADYSNFEIPEEIRTQGKESVQEFRRWFEGVKELLLRDPEAFVMRLHLRWGIVTNPKALKADNSGAILVENLDLENWNAK